MNRRKFREKSVEINEKFIEIREQELREQQIRSQIELIKLGLHPESNKSAKYYKDQLKDLIKEAMSEKNE